MPDTANPIAATATSPRRSTRIRPPGPTGAAAPPGHTASDADARGGDASASRGTPSAGPAPTSPNGTRDTAHDTPARNSGRTTDNDTTGTHPNQDHPASAGNGDRGAGATHAPAVHPAAARIIRPRRNLTALRNDAIARVLTEAGPTPTPREHLQALAIRAWRALSPNDQQERTQVAKIVQTCRDRTQPDTATRQARQVPRDGRSAIVWGLPPTLDVASLRTAAATVVARARAHLRHTRAGPIMGMVVLATAAERDALLEPLRQALRLAFGGQCTVRRGRTPAQRQADQGWTLVLRHRPGRRQHQRGLPPATGAPHTPPANRFAALRDDDDGGSSPGPRDDGSNSSHNFAHQSTPSATVSNTSSPRSSPASPSSAGMPGTPARPDPASPTPPPRPPTPPPANTATATAPPRRPRATGQPVPPPRTAPTIAGQLRVGSLNARGITNKEAELGMEVLRDLQLDVLAVQESWLPDVGPPHRSGVPGYTWFGRPRPDQHHPRGGVGFYVADYLAHRTRVLPLLEAAARRPAR